MITFFNRKWLITLNDLRILARAREILESNKVEYVINPEIITHKFMVSEYRIFVKKNEYEKAEFLIRNLYN